MLDHHVVFLDLETTGATPASDRIIEVGLVEVDRGRCIGEWSTLVNPGRRIPAGIEQLTGITNEMAARAPAFPDVSRQLAQRLDGKVLAAHNARFDYGFLKSEFHRAGIRYSAPVLCTVKLSRRLFPQYRHHNLDAVMARHAIECDARHRALGDARVLWTMMQIWERELDAERLNGAIADLLHYTRVPAGLPETVFDDLPEAPGVYLFYGAHDRALYVGKGANLRERVMSHFASDRRRASDALIADAIRRIDWIETAGELGALITEARLVRELAPSYNRTRSGDAEWWTWRWNADDGHAVPQLATAADVDTDSPAVYGVFRSRAAAMQALQQIASAHELCPSLLGLRTEPCAGDERIRCRGACIGLESKRRHAVRLAAALARLRLQQWPYPGAIAVRERDESRAHCELHVLDRWRYVGTARSEAELHELAASARSAAFDVDTYRMLARFLGQRGKADIIRLAV